jgi:hypothetical protein
VVPNESVLACDHCHEAVSEEMLLARKFEETLGLNGSAATEAGQGAIAAWIRFFFLICVKRVLCKLSILLFVSFISFHFFL